MQRLTPYKRGPAIERFFRHVQPVGECLIWTSTYAGSKSRHGTFSVPSPTGDGHVKVYAHRWIWEYLNGPIPDGMELDHVKDRGCAGAGCVKIGHLEVVSHDENMSRARLKLCRSGKHDLTDDVNVQWDAQGRRRGCAACKRESSLVWHRAKRGRSPGPTIHA